ncbi:MAG: CopG family transcriptional regulator, nickel-responsive regulator [Methanobacterium sp.]|jgi:CopG family nickel-responsive transcriptional regulator|uniref:nickel-responsive transcriptional regulator NikR n=1 Tax=Methanobacterium sp. TaxID=2164 RepID=UPI0003C9CBD5|nr:nickel-responsive transcriptional regulator NikR [Methanobacterium sp.]MDI3550611.1 CopG family transcriptional regulator, nickel-responsive regulator [Methanobacterium sp.]CDG65103.1 nickel responsive regulator [Methanobacterium sp. MB1]
MIRVSMSLPKKLLDEFDEVLRDMNYRSRSKGIRDALNDYIIRRKWIEEMDGERIGIISVIYNRYSPNVLENLSDIEYNFKEYISSVLKIYLDRNQCLEVMIVRGNIEYLKDLSEKIMKLKDIEHTKLTTSPIN